MPTSLSDKIALWTLLPLLAVVGVAPSPLPYAHAQTGPDLAPCSPHIKPVVTSGRSSEENSALLDVVIDLATKAPLDVIVISRLGRGETSRRLHERRLHNAVERLVYQGHGVPRQRVIPAAGERLNGKGRVEVYFCGKLIFISEMERGRDFLVDCCDEFPEYYPWYRGKQRVHIWP